MSGIIVSLIFSAAVQALKYGIGVLYEARKLRKPDLRDKEGTRVYLENLLRWAAYLHRSFFSDLATAGFTLGILLEIVRPGEKWDAFYEALAHDYNITTKFPPEKYDPPDDRIPERERRILKFCRHLKKRRSDSTLSAFDTNDDVSDLEKVMAEEYLAVVRRLLDHPAVLTQAQQTWRNLNR
jgi:hypothetical protein